MKKLLIFIVAAVFFAAGCNSQPPVFKTGVIPPAPTTAGAKVDAAVNALNRDIDSETALEMQIDNDLINSDQVIINSYNGVSNASSY